MFLKLYAKFCSLESKYNNILSGYPPLLVCIQGSWSSLVFALRASSEPKSGFCFGPAQSWVKLHLVDGPQEFLISLLVDLIHFVCFIFKLDELILDSTFIGQLCAGIICEKSVWFFLFSLVQGVSFICSCFI